MKTKSPLQIIKSQQGSLILQVLMASAIAMFIVYGISELTVKMSASQAQMGRKMGLMELRNEMITLLTSDTAWNKTVTHAFNASQTSSVCLSGTNGDSGTFIDCQGAAGDLLVVDSSDKIILDATSTSSGFSPKGVLCNTFNATTPNTGCPTRITARWVVDCASACLVRSPPLKIEVRFEHNYPNAVINTNNLNFVLRR